MYYGFKDFKFNYDYKNKDNCIDIYNMYMLARTQEIFIYTGLPDSIPQRMLELQLQMYGNVCVVEVGGKLYALIGQLGGRYDEYFRATKYIIANPYLNYNAELTVNEDCVLMLNDALGLGLMPLNTRYSKMLAECDISMLTALINSRITNIISAADDRTKASAELFLKRLADGDLGLITENSFTEGLKTLPYSGQNGINALKEIIEVTQYLKASWYNELGLNANYNLKRERLNSAETALNDDILLPYVEHMLHCRKDALTRVNEMYGTNICVSLNSVWEQNEQEAEISLEVMGENKK